MSISELSEFKSNDYKLKVTMTSFSIGVIVESCLFRLEYF